MPGLVIVDLLPHGQGLFVAGDGLGVLALLVATAPQAVEDLCDVGVGLVGVYLFQHGEDLFVVSNGLGVLALLVATAPQVVEDLCDVGTG